MANVADVQSCNLQCNQDIPIQKPDPTLFNECFMSKDEYSKEENWIKCLKCVENKTTDSIPQEDIVKANTSCDKFKECTDELVCTDSMAEKAEESAVWYKTIHIQNTDLGGVSL